MCQPFPFAQESLGRAAPAGQPRAAPHMDFFLDYFGCAGLSFWYDALRVPLVRAIGRSVG
jgi:hypothetical protein